MTENAIDRCSQRGRFVASRALAVAAMLALACASVLAARGPALAAPAHELDVIAHQNAPSEALSAYELEALFTRAQTRWNDGTAAVPLNAPIGSHARAMFDRAVLRLGPEQVGRFWLDRRIRGMGLPPRQVSDPLLTVKVVQNLPGAIAYVRSDLVSEKVRVVARIRNGRVLAP
jgi:hypothetical protein